MARPLTIPLRAYLAAPYVAREQVADFARELVEVGLDVTASWISEDHEITPGTLGAAPALTGEEVARHAATDLDDIERCDVLIVFTAAALGLAIEDCASGGRHVETGYALAKGVPVIVVGEPENVFHRLDHAGPRADEWWLQRVPEWADAVAELQRRVDEAQRWSA